MTNIVEYVMGLVMKRVLVRAKYNPEVLYSVNLFVASNAFECALQIAKVELMEYDKQDLVAEWEDSLWLK